MCENSECILLDDKSFIRFSINNYNFKNIYSIIWVSSKLSHMLDFCHQILPKIKSKFILVTSCTDSSVPHDYRNYPEIMNLLNDPKLIHWFTQNYYCLESTKSTTKISPIPIGINFHSKAILKKISIRQQEESLESILEILRPTHKRLPRIFVDWHLCDSLNFSPLKFMYNETRATIYKKLKSLPFIDSSPRFIPRTRLWNIKGRYAFSVSPFGNGMDCYRT